MKIVNYTILVNGESSAKARRHITPFLFAIALEYLSKSLNQLTQGKEFHFHPKCSRMTITHLYFAYDLLLFSRGDLLSVKAFQHCFQKFSLASELQANIGKSSLYCEGDN